MTQHSYFRTHGTNQSRLPTPCAVAQAHSLRLQELIADELAASGGRLSFSRFMELALYAPGLGYYSAGSHKLGTEGDFITAPEYSSLFSLCLARQVLQVLVALGGGDVLEVGGGSGIMAADVLDYLYAKDCLPRRYYILELSADLRKRQQILLKERLPQIQDRIVWLEQLPDPGFRGVVLANELLDALPVHCFIIEQDGIAELYVERKNDEWRWCRDVPCRAELSERIESLRRTENLPIGYISEINLSAEAWLGGISDILTAGMLLLVDYGFPRREYYHPQRSNGTLMCHYRHQAHGDPFILVGLQDITAHVDFTAIAEAGHAADFTVAGYTTQAAFLLSNGITGFMDEADNEQTRLEWARQIKKLTLPHEMGELFKVLALTRNFDEPLQGFAMRDLRHRL